MITQLVSQVFRGGRHALQQSAKAGVSALAAIAGVMLATAPVLAWAIPAPVAPRLEYFSGPTYTNLDVISVIAEFDSDVVNVDASDFVVTGTTATITAFSALSASRYQIEISGGNLADLNGEVYFSLAAGQDIESSTGTPLTNLAPSYGESPVTVNNTQPIGTFSSTSSGTVSGTFSMAVTFTPHEGNADNIVGFAQSDFVVTNGTVTNLNHYTADRAVFDVTPTATGTVTVELPADTYYDDSSNPNLASTPFSIEADLDPPTVVSITRHDPATEYTDAYSLAWRVEFSKPVSDVSSDDFQVSGSTAVVHNISRDGAGDDVWLVFASGGDLGTEGFAGEVGLGFSGAQNIVDDDDRALADTVPSGANETFKVSRVPPTLRDVLRHDPTGDRTNADSVTWDFAFSSISSFFALEPDDFRLTGTTATLSVERYSVGFYVTASGGDLADLDGLIQISIDGVDHFDEYGNRLSSPNPTGIWGTFYDMDNTAPTVEFSAGRPSVPGGSFDVFIEISEDYDTFDADDIVVGNGTVTSFSPYAQRRFIDIEVTPDGDGEVTIDVPAGTFNDLAGNPNTAAEQASVISDATPPTITSVEFVTTGGSPTNSDTLTWKITVSEPVLALDQYDFFVPQIGGFPTVTNPEPTVYLVEVSGGAVPDYNGTVSLQQTPNFSIRDHSNLYMESGAVVGGGAAEWTVTIDNIAPEAGIVSNRSSVADEFPILITTTEATQPITAGDITVTNGTIDGLGTSGTQTTVQIVPTSVGEVLVQLLPGSFTDLAGNANEYTASLSVQYEVTPPSLVSIERFSPTTETTNEDQVAWLVTFSETVENVRPGDFVFTGADAELAVYPVRGGPGPGRGQAPRPSHSDSGETGTRFQVIAYNGDIPDHDGLVTLTVSGANSITDLAGLDLVSTTPSGANDNTFYLANDVTSPSVVISDDDGVPAGGPFTVNVDFDEPVSGLTTSDFVVVNATITGMTGSDGDSAYVLSLTPNVEGTVTIDLPADAAEDAAGNASLAADQYSRDYDTTGPVASFSSAASDPVSGRFTLAVDFNEDVTGFTLSDLVIANGTGSGFAGSGANYSLEIDPDFAGSVTVDMAASVATDLAGNDNQAATQFVLGTDNQAPGVLSIERGGSGTTNADSLSWRVTFSEDMGNVEGADFVVAGVSGATITVTDIGGGVFEVTVSGGDLADLSGSVSLGFASTQDIADAAGNLLSDTTPSGTNETGYEVDNIAPGVTLTSEATDPVIGAFALQVSFSESVTGLAAADFVVGNGSAADLTGSGMDYTVTITPGADGDITVDLPAGAADDAAGNGNTVAEQFSIGSDITAPTVVLATQSADAVAGAFTLEATFSESVTGLAVDDFVVDNGAASELSGSGTDYTLTITPSADGTVTVDLPMDAAADAAGNGSLAADSFTIENDQTGPTATLASDVELPITDAFTLTVTFDEAVTGFALEDLVVVNGSLSDFAGDGAVYTVLVTPGEGSALTIDLAAGVATDGVGNPNSAAEQFSVVLDNTPPEPTITLPGAETEGAFVAEIGFSEAVTGFELTDMSATNADLSEFTVVSDTAFTVMVTPQTLGTVVLSIAADSAQDAAGNGNTAASAEIEAISRAIEVSVDLGEEVTDPTDVSAEASISNPGSQPVAFRVEVDVPWLDVDPMSGTIPALGELDLTITVNALANELEAGTYTGTITVINLDGDAIAKGPNAVSHAAGDTIVVAIPLTVTIAERRGTIQLVSTTPGGVQRDATFAFSSSDADLDGLSLTTANGYAETTPVRKLLGQYDVTQSLPQGWRLDTLSCVGDTDGGSVIDLAAGRVDIDLDANEDIVCTFANTRDEAEIRLATQRTIRNFMVRRADRILDAAPDLTRRLRDRDTRSPGQFSADINGGTRMMSMSTSLSGMRNHARDSAPQMDAGPGATNPRGDGLDVWLSARYSSLSDDRTGEGTDSAFGVLQLGADWSVGDGTLVGVLVQRDWMDEQTDDIAVRAGGIRGARVGGTGWLAGPYVVHQLTDGVWFDAMALYGQSSNTVDPLGLYEDEFETSRYLLRMNLSGEWQSGAWRIRPSASLAHFEETQDAYVDSLAIDIPSQTIAIGRLEAGPEFAYRFAQADGGWWEPSLGLTGVWDYNPAELLNENGLLVGTGDVRLDARLGLQGQLAPGASIALEADVSGLGDGDFEARSARIELRLSFN